MTLGCAVTVALAGSANVWAAKAVKITHEHRPGELVVKLKDKDLRKAETEVFSGLLKSFGKNSVLSIRPFQTDNSLHVVRLAKDENLAAAIQKLSKDGSVAYAEPNYIMRTFDVAEPAETPSADMPNDTEFGRLWGMKNSGQADSSGQMGTPNSDINVLPLWQMGIRGSRNVVVAVIDTGIDWTHPDLVDNLYTNPGEIPGDGIDNDKNGFIDDVHGWNFEANTNNSNDDNNHGTHCAGTIGGVGNNAQGVVGVNWEVSLMPVKFLSAGGSGTLEGAINSINYATMMKVNVMSNSWGGGGFTESMKAAIEAARDMGIAFVAAAGNNSSNNNSEPTYPAGYEVANVISVAASDNKDQIAGFSNWGSRTVHVAAPGVRVYSTTKGGTYNTFSGTSMATPHVSGIAALMWSAAPELTFAEIKERLIKTSDRVPSLERKSISKGRVNAYAAVNNIVPPNDDPKEEDWMTAPTSIESAHPYENNVSKVFDLAHPGAKFIRVKFQMIDVEDRYDSISVESKTGESIDSATGKVENYLTDYIRGDALKIRLDSDSSVNGYGFKVVEYQYVP